jgi:alpha-glucosidase
MLISSDGQYIWAEFPMKISFDGTNLNVTVSKGHLVHSNEHTNLRDAYLAISNRFFPPSGKLPDLDLVRYPQYNTWIELMYDQNQHDILKYANDILANGFPPGVIMIDDNWQENYGVWKFHTGRFPDPKLMIDSLHQMGFKVMLWVCPFVSPDSYTFRELRSKDILLKNKDGAPAILRWWNGYSALLDFTNPAAVDWFSGQLKYLHDYYGVDGFKLDAGDSEYYEDLVSFKPVVPNEHSRLFGEFGLDYPLNEYRAMWKMGGQPLVQRLRDKDHNWEHLPLLIPHILTQGILGYPFTCPDMIGGGEFMSFLNADTYDQELVVRSAQVHALMPMMQFSVAPWRILDQRNLEIVKEALKVRELFIDTILDLTKSAAITGEPVVRLMEYVFPHQGYLNVQDQFMVGDNILVAPIVNKDQFVREIKIPAGNWIDWNGKQINGPAVINVDTPIDIIPYFVRQ